MSNLRIWDALSRTDPAHTKKFDRAGGFKGTAVKPIYTAQKMTDTFGPCGIGWGLSEPTYQLVNGPEGEVVVYCWLSIWYRDPETKERSEPVHGVGGDFAVSKNKYGLRPDDEAFKKAFTDALGNAMKQLGMSADVHMGQHDDDKYVSALRRELADDKAQENVEREQPAPRPPATRQPTPPTNPLTIPVHPSPDGNGSDWGRWEQVVSRAIGKTTSLQQLNAFMEANQAALNNAPEGLRKMLTEQAQNRRGFFAQAPREAAE